MLGRRLLVKFHYRSITAGWSTTVWWVRMKQAHCMSRCFSLYNGRRDGTFILIKPSSAFRGVCQGFNDAAQTFNKSKQKGEQVSCVGTELTSWTNKTRRWKADTNIERERILSVELSTSNSCIFMSWLNYGGQAAKLFPLYPSSFSHFVAISRLVQ